MEVPRPICAVCKKPVASMIEDVAEAMDEITFLVACHGETETYVVDLRTWAANRNAAVSRPAFRAR